MHPSPIIILASERSGTNLLRKLVSNHSNICGPIAPHLLAEFAPIVHLYGDISCKKNANRLFDDMLRIVNHPYHGWQLNVSFEDICKEFAPSCLLHFFHVLYTLKARQECKSRYISKGIHSFDYANELVATFPNTKLLYLVRDPRDHVASWMKKPINLLSPYDAIQTWIKEQENVFKKMNISSLPVHTVKYEDLVSNTPKTMERILNFVEEPVEETCFQTDPGKADEAVWNPHWENLAKPVMTDNFNKFKKRLDPEDIDMIETLAQDAMSRLGYGFTTECHWRKSETYFEKVQKQREANQKKCLSESAEQGKRLEDRWALTHDIRSKLCAPSTGNNLVPGNKAHAKKPQKKTVGKILRNRLKYLSFTFLGQKGTHKVALLFRKS